MKNILLQKQVVRRIIPFVGVIILALLLGLGLIVLAVGMIFSPIIPFWISVFAAALGLAGMLLTMAFPDNLEFYKPVFHLNLLWLLIFGAFILF